MTEQPVDPVDGRPPSPPSPPSPAPDQGPQTPTLEPGNPTQAPEPGPPAGTSATRMIAIALAAVGVLVVLSVVVILAFGSAGVREYPAGTPEATVQAYVRAIDGNDLPAAYALLSARLKTTLTESAFTDRVTMYGYSGGDGPSRVVRIDRTDLRDDRATVDLTLEQYYDGGGGLGPNRATFHPTMLLVREGGSWKLDQLYVGPELMPEAP